MSQKEIDILSLRQEYDKRSYTNIINVQDEIPTIRNIILNRVSEQMNIECGSIMYSKVENIIHDMMTQTNMHITGIKQTQYMDDINGINTTDTKKLFEKFSENKEDNCKHYNKRVEDMLENIVNDTMLQFITVLDPAREGENYDILRNVDKILHSELKDKLVEKISEYDHKLDGEFSEYLRNEIDKFEKENAEQEKEGNTIDDSQQMEQNSFESQLKSKTFSDDEVLQNDINEASKETNKEIEKDAEKSYTNKKLIDFFK